MDGTPGMSVVQTAATWGRMVKLSHSVFALPFALSGAALAAARYGLTVRQVVWILVAMFAARNAAMGFNRLADHTIDARNPRTAGRELPRGLLSRGAVWAFTVALTAIFVFATYRLNTACMILAPVALLVIFGYSFTKRFTWASHLVLGLALAFAPAGGWLAVAGRLEVEPVLMAAAVLTWVAGFDVIYACQDVAFDRSSGLHSIPARFGVRAALRLARGLHVVAVLLLAAIGATAHLHPSYWVGIVAIAAILIWEHRLLDADDLSKVGMAFFNANGIVSVVYFVVLITSLWLGRA